VCPSLFGRKAGTASPPSLAAALLDLVCGTSGRSAAARKLAECSAQKIAFADMRAVGVSAVLL